MTERLPTPDIGPLKNDVPGATVRPNARPSLQATQHNLPVRYWDPDRILTVAALVHTLVFPAMLFGLPAYAFLGPMLIPTLIALGLMLAWKRPWTYLTTGILGSLFPLFAVVFLGTLGGQLSNPLVAPEYSASLLSLFSLVLLWAGVVPGFRKARVTGPAPYRRTSTDRGRLAARGQTILVIATVSLLVGAMGTSFMAESKASAHIGGGYDFVPDARTEFVVEDFTFASSDPTVAQGVITEIAVTNKDREPHTFTYKKDGRVYDHFLPRGETVGFLVLFDGIGTIDFWCVPHSAGADDDGTGMIGTFQVVAPAA